ncbi:MAG: response regulator transcription factor [Clostridiaceae bacterium]|nr:response regulator transcription factor [Clostridiaceae bacterium]
MKILIVDDEKHIVKLIQRGLEMEGYEAFCAYNGNEAIQMLKKTDPDIILLDIMLPDIDGYNLLEKIHKYDSARPVIFVTAQDKLVNRILGFELGADDYITKPFNTKELVLKIKALWRRMHQTRSINDDKRTIHKGRIEIHPLLRKVFVDGEERILTYKEFDTIYLLARNYSHVYSRDQLLNEIWGFDYTGNTRAVDILIKRLRKKIEPCDGYIQTLYGVGYKFEVNDDDKEFS